MPFAAFLTLLAGLLALVPASAPGAEPSAADRRPIATLYLFVHCLGESMPAAARAEYTERWRELFGRVAADPATAICFLSSGPSSLEVAALARKSFGDRCVVDPRDDGPETRNLMLRDLQVAFRDRGMNGEWEPYEMWTSTNARRWSEGLEAEFAARGLAIDPERTRIIACGRAWDGCLAKYSAFMSRYLGLSRAAEMIPALSPDAGSPLGGTFRERVPLDRHVMLYLFETADGRPFGQFIDGLRGVAEPPHVAAIDIDRSRVQLVTQPPHGSMRPQPVVTALASGPLLVDVGDGCRPVFTTVVGTRIDYTEFKAALAAARIEPLATRYDSQTLYIPPPRRGSEDAP
jgi:hypothetical protein